MQHLNLSNSGSQHVVLSDLSELNLVMLIIDFGCFSPQHNLFQTVSDDSMAAQHKKLIMFQLFC